MILDKLNIICPACFKEIKICKKNKEYFSNIKFYNTFKCKCLEYRIEYYTNYYNEYLWLPPHEFKVTFITQNICLILIKCFSKNWSKSIDYNTFLKNDLIVNKKILIISKLKLSNILDYIEKINLLK